MGAWGPADPAAPLSQGFAKIGVVSNAADEAVGELREVLAVILSSAVAIRRRGSVAEHTDKHLQRIHEHVERANELLKDLDRRG